MPSDLPSFTSSASSKEKVTNSANIYHLLPLNVNPSIPITVQHTIARYTLSAQSNSNIKVCPSQPIKSKTTEDEVTSINSASHTCHILAGKLKFPGLRQLCNGFGRGCKLGWGGGYKQYHTSSSSKQLIPEDLHSHQQPCANQARLDWHASPNPKRHCMLQVQFPTDPFLASVKTKGTTYLPKW